MKGTSSSIPNQNILINTLSLQEAKDSSEVENIVTTHDELYQQDVFSGNSTTVAAKEVSNYIQALMTGFDLVKEKKILSENHIKQIQEQLEKNKAGYRTAPGTSLKNQKGVIVYIPPQDANEIKNLMRNLEQYINDEEMSDVDPLIKMAVIHYQFETIHPFYDGNGRTGRIINILYLVQQRLLDLPVLYLSRFINKNKADYYSLIQAVRDEQTNEAWQDWIRFILNAVTITSLQTMILIVKIKGLMLDTKHEIRENFPKIYSQELLNNLFKHPYTKIEYIMRDLSVQRLTASKYLNMLVKHGLLEKIKRGRTNYYVNLPLVDLLFNVA